MSEVRVLLIENADDDRQLVKVALERNAEGKFFTIEEATTGAEGLALASARTYDCILLDIGLPDGSGLTWMQRLRALPDAPPVIIQTGQADRQTAFRALAAGAQDYLVKGTFDGDTLTRAIRCACERHRIASELEMVRVEVSRVAFLDALTGVLNRRGAEHLLPGELARSARQGGSLFAVLIDLDDFKRVNDIWGHSTGDAVLVEVAARISRTVRPTDHLCRIGGDEFLLVLSDTNKEEALVLAHRVRAAIRDNLIMAGNEAVDQTISLGVFAIPPSVISVTDVLSFGENALRRSKGRGKDQVSCGEWPQTRSGDRITEVPTLGAVAQAIVRLSDRSTIGCELLVRGLFSDYEQPQALFEQARSEGSSRTLDLLALDTCLQSAAALRLDDMHVNLLWGTLAEIDPAALVTRLPPDLATGGLCIGLNAQDLVGDPSLHVAAREALRSHGLRVALDGVDLRGQSLEALIVLKPDVIKIDHALLRRAARETVSGYALGRIVGVGRAIGAQIVAVGVESDVELRLLESAGVQYGQGFALGVPSASWGGRPLGPVPSVA
jgi:diguanylate cyclase